MPSWFIKERPTGDIATLKVELTGVIVEALLQDCDGDFISYMVKDNGNVVAKGELRSSPEMTYDQCWIEAKRLANLAIMTSNKPVVIKEAHKPRVVKDFADIGNDESKPKKKPAGKHGREKGERRSRDDKWADA